MAFYEVDFTPRQLFKMVRVEANSPLEALQVAMKQAAQSDWKPSLVYDPELSESYDYVASCEACWQPILDGSEYKYHDGLGVYFCERCSTQ